MIDDKSQFLAILTAVGEAKQANADALGIPWLITHMGVGDANNTDPFPDRLQTSLIHEQRRAPLNQLTTDDKNPGLLIAEQVIPADVGGWWVRELGLYDSDGDLVAVSNCAPSYKPLLSQGSGRTQVVRMTFIISSTANVVLKIDPSVVLATRDYVDRKVLEELNKQDFKHSVLVATTGPIALIGTPDIDGTPITAGARVLVKDQPNAKDNGPYLAADGIWKRTRDADASNEATPGLFVHVEKGEANGDSIWQLVSDAPIVLGTSDLQFEIVAGRTGVGAGTYRSVTVDKLGRVIAGTNPTTAEAYGLAEDLAWPLTMLPLPVISSEDGRITVTADGVEGSGGTVSVSAGVLLGLGEEVVEAISARLRTLTTSAWTSPNLGEGREYFLRAQVVGGQLHFYIQGGTVFDVAPASLKGTPDGDSGGGFQSTVLDICIARVLTGVAGAVPVVHPIYNRTQSWTQSVNGTGVVYLPLDPHVRGARLVVANPTPAPGVLSQAAFDQSDWVGGNYVYFTPGSAAIAPSDGWNIPYACQMTTNNLPGDVTITTLTASFDHKEARSLWQSYQAEHQLGAITAISDELLLSMGIKNVTQSDYDNGIAINFTDAVNMHLTWEVMR